MGTPENPTQPDTAKKRLLVIDDEELVGTLLVRFLKNCFEVTTTTDPEAALEDIEKRDFDLILTDFKMPKVSGLDIVKRAKAVKPNLPVVVMSGHIAPEQGTKDMIAAGADAFLGKPFPRKADVQAFLLAVLDRAK